MNCKNCNTINSTQASYCRNCGQALENNKPDDQSQTIKVDTILMVFIGIIVFNALFSCINNLFYPNWVNSPLRNVQITLWAIVDMSYLLVPFVIKNKKLKVIGIVIIALVNLYKLSQLIIPLI